METQSTEIQTAAGTEPAAAPKPRKPRGPYKPRKGKAPTPEQMGEFAFMRLSNGKPSLYPAPWWQFWKWRKQLIAAAGVFDEAMQLLQPLALRAAAKDGEK